MKAKQSTQKQIIIKHLIELDVNRHVCICWCLCHSLISRPHNPPRDSLYQALCQPYRSTNYAAFHTAELKQVIRDLKRLDITGHPSIFHMTTIGFSPAWELTLVNSLLSPQTSNIIHPDRTSAYRARERKIKNTVLVLYHKTKVPMMTQGISRW